MLTAGSITGLIDNSLGGFLGAGGNILVSTGGDFSTTSGGVNLTIQNTDGTITTGGNLTLTVGNDLTTQTLTLFVENYDEVSTNPAGHIGTGGNLFVTTGGDLTADSVNAVILNRTGGRIDSGVSMIFTIGGALTTTGDASFAIASRFDDTDLNASMLGSTIGGDATLLISASSVNVGGISFSGISNSGSTLDGSATYIWNVIGDMTIQGDANLEILNDADAASPLGGALHGGATIQLNAANLTAGSLLTMIDNRSGGVIDLDATTNLFIAGNVTSPGDVTFEILNDQHPGIGTSGGSIGGNATINVTANTLSPASLLAEIDNTGGTIGGDATMNMNVSGSATVTTDATIEILGSDGAASAAINVNGGSYDVGGTFLTEIDGDGAVTFNNVIGHADVLKVGALGTNGVLTIGGGSLSGDTTLKLYASGSNGTVNFISNVSLSSNSSVIIAGNTVTLNNGVVVTITGDDGVNASVFTNVPNYTGSGGNGSTTGMFAGNGAQTAPLDQAPPFDDSPKGTAKSSTTSAAVPIPTTNSVLPLPHGSRGNTTLARAGWPLPFVRVSNSSELLDLADKIVSAPSHAGRSGPDRQTGRNLPGPKKVVAGHAQASRLAMLRAR
jgi:hypothetical protein